MYLQPVSGWLLQWDNYCSPVVRKVNVSHFLIQKFLMHQPWSGGIQGQTTDILIQAREMEKTRSTLYQIISEHSGKTIEKIQTDAERDNFMTPEEAKDYGLIDSILVYRDKPKKD